MQPDAAQCHAGIRPAAGRSRRAAGRLQPGRTRIAADRGEARFVFARLDAQPGPLPGFTTALVGMRNQYTYSPTERYEHIYLNDNFYAWQCLDGVEKGLADVDRCHYVQVAEDLYLFVWREKIIPTLGVILIDLQQMRTDGKIMGYQGSDFGALSNFPVGASAKILNVTRHQE